MPMGLHHLRYFVAVADEGHISRAAARLRISQPSLSAQIQYLEREVGIALVQRHARGVTVTPAGVAFLEQARVALAAARAAVDAARRAGHAQAGILKIGFIVGTQIEITGRILTLFQAKHPEVTAEFTEHSFTDPSAGLNSGEVDVAFVVQPFQHNGLAFLPLDESPRLAVLPATHPLAGRDAISIKEILDERWAPADTDDLVCRDFWLAMEHRDGPARLGQRIRSLDKLVQLVMSGNAIGLLSQWAIQAFDRPGLAFVPVTDVAPVVTALAWFPGRHSALVNQFVETAREALTVRRRRSGSGPDSTR
jgi:DNA-binding transcriptional LysR family regulator